MSEVSDIAARAIVAACKELKTDPIFIARGGTDEKLSNTYPISRSRAYAALALHRIFEGKLGRPSIARMVGASSPDAYLSTLARRVELGQCPWYDPTIAARVLEAALG